jgi:hypothetical protein
MSHHSDFTMTVLDKADITAYFGEQLAALLIGKEEDKPLPPANIAMRTMRGYTRSDWFKWIIGELLNKTPYNSLQFLSEKTCTHLVLANYEDKIVEESYLDSLDAEADEDELEFMTCYYTVIPPEKTGELLDAVNSLFSWCSTNIAVVSDVIEEDEEEVKTAIDNALFYEKVNNAHYGEEGQGADFLFCALKSIQELLAYAKQHHLYAIYKNENYTGLEWLKKFRPHIITF